MSSPQAVSAMSTSIRRLSYPSVWLDILPLDISAKIVSFLPRHRINHEISLQHLPDAISLSAVSPVQEIAVSTSWSHRLIIEHVNNSKHTTELIRLWTDILHHVREVQLPIDVSNNDDVRKLLSSPTIRKAVIPNYPCLLRALHSGRSVRSLELRVTIYCPENGEKGLATDISQLLTECPIETLSIFCLGCDNCPHLTCFATYMLKSMKNKKNSLRSLHLKCTSEQMDCLVRLQSIFPTLEEFRLEHWVSVDRFFLDHPVQLNMAEEIYENLRRLKRLRMINCGSIDTFIPLGFKLVELRSLIQVHRREVMALSACSNLRALDIVVEEGAEVFFPRNLRNLREVSLTWNPDHRPRLDQQYYAPLSESLTGLIRNNKNITHLSLKNLMISSPTLKNILSATSTKLRALFVPIFHQDESAASRFSRLACLIMRYNTNLSDLEICSASFGRSAKLPVLLDHESGTCDPNICPFCDLRRRIDSVIGVLKRRVLRFCDDGIRRLEFNLEPWRMS